METKFLFCMEKPKDSSWQRTLLQWIVFHVMLHLTISEQNTLSFTFRKCTLKIFAISTIARVQAI